MELKRRVVEGESTGLHLLVTGGVHGDEFEPMAAVRELMRTLQPEALCGRVTLVPVVNEAAFRRGHRCADDGLDLARTCPGRAEGSVTERTAYALCELIRTADFYIDLHTGGTTIDVWPLAGYMLHPDRQVLQQQRAMAESFNLAVVWGTTPDLPGRSLSFARDQGIPAIYAEYRGAGRYHPEGTAAYVEGCQNVMGLLGMLDRPSPPSRVEHIIEETSEQSGHMQLQHPAPLAGIFQPAVVLGQRVCRDDPLGTVCDELGARVEPVRSQHEGLVLTIKTVCYVAEHEGVSIIVDPESGRID